MTRGRATLLTSGLAYLAVFVALGAFVSHGRPGAFDRSGMVFFDQARPLAIFATESGLFPIYSGLSIAALVIGIARRAFLGRAVFLAAMLFATWKIGDVAKLAFHRVRPAHWLWVFERSPSYASGHAALAVAGYGMLAAYVWRSPLPRRERAVLAGALLLWIVTIDWSRMALGAHYPTDLIGGTLLGLGLIQLGRAIWDPLRVPQRARVRRGR